MNDLPIGASKVSWLMPLVMSSLAALLVATACGDDDERALPTCQQTGCQRGFVCVGAVCLPDTTDTGPQPDTAVQDDADAGEQPDGEVSDADDDAGQDADAQPSDVADDSSEPTDTGADDADTTQPDDVAEDVAEDTTPDVRPDVSVDVSVDAPPVTCVQLGCPGRQTCDDSSGDCVEPAFCLQDVDCLEGRGCLHGACTDAADMPECRVSEECPDGQACSILAGECGATGPCFADSDCAGADKCDLAGTGMCAQCTTDGDCPGSQTCHATARVCVEASPCSSDDDCLGARVCTSNACAAPACTADAFEPNDSHFEAASGLTAGTHDLTLCNSEEDWFALSGFSAGDAIIARAEYDPAYGRLEMEIQDADGEFLARGADASGHPVAVLEAAPAGAELLLWVRTVNGNSIPYELQLDVIAGGVCIDDSFEPNMHAEQAADLPLGETVGATLCAGSDDWFAFSASSGQTITVTVGADSAGPVAVALFEGQSSHAVLRDTQAQAEKVLQTTAATAADYWVRVYPINAASEGDYLIRVDVQ